MVINNFVYFMYFLKCFKLTVWVDIRYCSVRQTTNLTDSHQQLMVHWVGEGSNVIICLARDSSPRTKGVISPSALFISYNYGKNFTNKTEHFRLGDTADSGYAQLDKFFNHPKYPEFVSINGVQNSYVMCGRNQSFPKIYLYRYFSIL